MKTIEEIEQERNTRYITKTDGKGNLIDIVNPDYFDEDGNFKKIRKKNTHLLPKKKKRK
jgi:hypothetical protein